MSEATELPILYIGCERAEGTRLERMLLPVVRVEKYRDGFIAVTDYWPEDLKDVL